jgi:Bacterial membrane protein YfhO
LISHLIIAKRYTKTSMFFLAEIKSFFISPRRADLLSYAFLLLLPLLFFGRETLGYFTLGTADVIFWFYPIWKLAAEQIKSGQLPLWNPYNYSGMPLFAEWQPGLLDPFNWIQLLGPSSRTLTIAQQASFSIALLGMFMFARQLGMMRRASIVSAVIYALNGYLVARTIYPGLLHITALMPFVLFFIERLYQTGSWRAVVLGGLIVAWQIFAGHPQPLLYSSLLAVAYAIFCAFLRRTQNLNSQVEAAKIGSGLDVAQGAGRLGFLIRCALMFIIGITLSAVQLLPAWEVAHHSERHRIPYEVFGMNSLHPITLLTTIFPFFHGGGKAIYQLPYWGAYWNHNEAQIYLGVLALSLAVSAALCFWRERSRLILFWTGVPIVACLLAFGIYLDPIARIIYQLPLLNLFRSPGRHWMEVAMAVAVLAGYAVDHILRDGEQAVARVAQIVATALTLLTAAIGGFILWRRDQAEAFIRGLPDMGFLSQGFLHQAGAEFYLPVISSACLLAVLLIFARTRRPGRWYLLLLSSLIIDFGLYAAFAPINRPGKLESGKFESPIGKSIPPELAARQSERDPIRYHLLLNPGPIAFNPYWFYGHEMATGYDPLINLRYTTFSSIDEVGRSTLPTLLADRDRTLDLLNVHYLLIPRRMLDASISGCLKDNARWREITVSTPDPGGHDMRVYQNTKALPRVWLVDRVELQPDPAQLQLIRGDTVETKRRAFDPRETALIDPSDATKLDRSLLDYGETKHNEAGSKMPADPVEIRERETSRMLITADITRPSLLVMSEPVYPGWHARVDGREVELLRVNYLLRGIGLAPGRHDVEIFYWPSSLTIGGIISGLTLLLSLALIIWDAYKRRVALRSHIVPD